MVTATATAAGARTSAVPSVPMTAPVAPGSVLDCFMEGADAAGFNDILQREVDRVCERVVIPLVRQAWPDVDQSGFMPKLRTCIGAYTHVGLCCVACSPARPWPFQALSLLSRALRFKADTLAGIVRVSLPSVFRVVERERAERLALLSALIIVFDEALDSPDTPKASRAEAVLGVMNGATPTTSRLAALEAVWKETQSRVKDAADRKKLDEIVDLYTKWAQAEQKNIDGVPDPTGYCHRKEAMVASMAGLAWAITPYAGDTELSWLIHIAECAQMVDDILDMEKDAAEGRFTPAHTGMWTLDTIRAGFAEVEKALVAGLAAAGDTHGAYLEMCVMVCREQCHKATRILIDHP